VLLNDLVTTSMSVAGTRSRSAKVALLADLIARFGSDEIEIGVGFLIGEPRQRRLNVGWATAWKDKTTAAEEPTVTVLDVDRCFQQLADASGTGSQTARTALVTQLFGRATHDEQNYLRRLIVGEMRQGALEGVVTDAVAKAAGVPLDVVRRAAMLTGDIGRTAVVAGTAGLYGLGRIGLRVLQPVQPMLASTAASVSEAVEQIGRSSIEWKLDGIRIQVHRDGEEVRIFTRNLNDVTHRFPGVVEIIRSLPATRVILDGELIGLHEDDVPRLFQETAGSFGSEGGSNITLQPFFFDCLHADGIDLIDVPLIERQVTLARVTGAMRIPTLETTDGDVASAFSDEALAAGHEGVMVKALDSLYEAGRRGKSWRKVKPVRTLDLVVLAAEWGHGRRQGWLSNLHLGARVASTNPTDCLSEASLRDGSGSDQARHDFVMVGKTFKGMTDALLTWQTEQFLERKVEERGIEVHVRPEIVVEIAVDGVQKSTRYPGGVALRFARVKRYRPDKTPADADTIEAVQALLPITR
jgi:DNA ligase 1